MEIKILGSVSPYCKDEKNCPGYLIKNNNNTKILLDAGNGISRLLDMQNDLNNLTIFISHLHKDHYGELFPIGYASYVYHNHGYLNNKIKVYIPKEELIDSEFLRIFKENYLEFITYNEKDIFNIDNFKISFSKNPHQIETYSIKIEEKNKTFVYSSDTGYSKNTLEKFSKECDLFICESTFLKNQTKSIDTHLYAYEAALIAKKANVKRLILTHFWPEIEESEYLKEADIIFRNTEVAKEGKILKL